jgi:hypothetical protein
MAGSFEVESGKLWNVPGWLFYDTMAVLSDLLAGTDLAARIDEVEANNLGWFSMKELSVEERETLRQAITDGLLQGMESLIPKDYANRGQVIDIVKELVRLASGSS